MNGDYLNGVDTIVVEMKCTADMVLHKASSSHF